MNITPLSDQTRLILQLLAEGQSSADILIANPHLGMDAIADAAKECLNLDDATRQRIPKSGKTNLRTYEVWTTEDDERLTMMFAQSYNIPEISKALERHPATVRRRLSHLGLD